MGYNNMKFVDFMTWLRNKVNTYEQDVLADPSLTEYDGQLNIADWFESFDIHCQGD